MAALPAGCSCGLSDLFHFGLRRCGTALGPDSRAAVPTWLVGANGFRPTIAAGPYVSIAPLRGVWFDE